MDEENSGSTGTPEQDLNAKASTDVEVIGAGTDLGAQSPIADKTLAEIASGVVKVVESDAKDTLGEVEVKVGTKAHEILDELEAHLSQFDARTVAIYHDFLNRLRNAL